MVTELLENIPQTDILLCKMSRYAIVILTYVTSITHISQAECPVLEILNAEFQVLDGHYRMEEYITCYDYPVYESEDLQYNLYYDGYYWAVYNLYECPEFEISKSNSSFARVRSREEFPELIEEIWEERRNGRWVINPDLKIICKDDTPNDLNYIGLGAGMLVLILMFCTTPKCLRGEERFRRVDVWGCICSKLKRCCPTNARHSRSHSPEPVPPPDSQLAPSVDSSSYDVTAPEISVVVDDYDFDSQSESYNNQPPGYLQASRESIAINADHSDNPDPPPPSYEEYLANQTKEELPDYSVTMQITGSRPRPPNYNSINSNDEPHT